ncbi:hypothetical protein [Streptomyces sp. NPDC059649]|uniref:hypothetical protein n=1 Tax=Streptomyces sp. NPDC059649 TaxID=3346895 RepID=UPI00369522EE
MHGVHHAHRPVPPPQRPVAEPAPGGIDGWGWLILAIGALVVIRFLVKKFTSD